jgi:hypothetical protein
MEKRFRRVQRWLERCIEACRKEKWSNAVADVECARAELETAKDELWLLVSEARAAEKAGYAERMLPLSLRSAFLAVVVVMAAAFPLSTGTVPVALEQVENKVSLEWVTRDEKRLLTSLRQNLSDMNSARNTLGEATKAETTETVGEPGQKVAKTSSTSAAVHAGGSGQTGRQDLPGQSSGTKEEDVTIDEILALYEIGQRALRSDSVVIQETNK